MTVEPVPLPSALPVLEIFNTESPSHASEAPLVAVNVSVAGPDAASGWAPNGMATRPAEEVETVGGALNTGDALPALV